MPHKALKGNPVKFRDCPRNCNKEDHSYCHCSSAEREDEWKLL